MAKFVRIKWIVLWPKGNESESEPESWRSSLKNELNTCRKWLLGCCFCFHSFYPNPNPMWRAIRSPFVWHSIHLGAGTLLLVIEVNVGWHSLWPHSLDVHRLWMSFIMSQFIQEFLARSFPLSTCAHKQFQQLVSASVSMSVSLWVGYTSMSVFFVGCW